MKTAGKTMKKQGAQPRTKKKNIAKKKNKIANLISHPFANLWRPDSEVYDVPGALPISLDDFALGWARK